MIEHERLKPIRRSRIRAFLGKRYYIGRRHLHWIFGGNRFSKISNKANLAHSVFMHRTPLYRKLKNVDLWLQENKVENLKIASKRIDGILIRPGETFSYWKTIGKPTVAKGYKDGMVLHYGNFKAGVGGGLCQMSNLIYWMALHSPLTVTERHRHSFDVFPDANRTQPFGSGATCVYNYRDLQILNETDETYQIKISLDGEYLHGEILSDREKYFDYSIYEDDHRITHEIWGGYARHNQIWRKTHSLSGEEVANDLICENHALMMYEPLLTMDGDLERT